MAKQGRKLLVRVLYRFTAYVNDLKSKLRKLYYKALGARIGNNVKLGLVQIPVPEQVIIGNNCELENNVRLRVGGQWKMSSITIGEDTFIGHSSQINVGSHFHIGRHCMIAPLCVFSDAHHNFDDLNIPIKEQGCMYLPIEIRDNVWIGSGVTILGGVIIHSGAVVAAGAVVTHNIPAYEVWGGVPAKKIKSRLNDR